MCHVKVGFYRKSSSTMFVQAYSKYQKYGVIVVVIACAIIQIETIS